MISIISAVADDNVIGYKNTLPWGNSIPADMKHFVEITRGKPVIMGFNTYKSIGMPLSGRLNIILAKDQPKQENKDSIFVESKEEALKEAKKTGAKEIMIIGGASIYKLFMPETDRIYLTQIHGKFEGDTYFPEIDMSKWREVDRKDKKLDERDKYHLEFIIYERNK